VVGALTLPLLSAVLPAWGIWRPGPELEVVEVIEEVLAPLESTSTVAPSAADGQDDTLPTMAGPVTTPLSASGWRPSLGAGLVAVWLLVTLALLSRLVVGLFWTWRLGRRGIALIDEEWIDALEEAADEMGLSPRGLRLCLSLDARVPTMVGILGPAVCLPPEASEWGWARRRMVLLHELAHIRHGDNVLNLLGQVLCALHWFNPLAWWVVRRLAAESEHAADDAVLAAGERPSDYAFELVRLARTQRTGLAAASPMSEPSWLKVRVAWIMDRGRRRRGMTSGQRLLFRALGVGLVALLSCVTSAPPEEDVPSRTGDTSSLPIALTVAEFYDVPAAGVELTIDEPLQTIVDDEVRNLVDLYHPRSVSVVAIDPCNGHVLALGTHGQGGMGEVVRPREPGSIMKPITIAAALEEGMSPEARFFCENGLWIIEGRPVRDANAAGWLDVRQIVARSSNIGAGHIYQDELGWDRLRSWLSRFQFGERPAVQLSGVEAGEIPTAEGSAFRGVMAASGVGLQASPIQVAAAYAALANGGVYHAPTLARRVRDGEGRTLWEQEAEGQRLVSERTARTVVDMLESAVQGDGTGRNARVEGLSIAGKTGTMQIGDEDGDGELEFYASFVGIVQPEDPQMVLLLGVEGVEGEGATGGQLAAPAFARIVSRARAAGGRVE
jgi:beta-lactamase regulating signal transducer with metallopeptidase domain